MKNNFSHQSCPRSPFWPFLSFIFYLKSFRKRPLLNFSVFPNILVSVFPFVIFRIPFSFSLYYFVSTILLAYFCDLSVYRI